MNWRKLYQNMWQVSVKLAIRKFKRMPLGIIAVIKEKKRGIREKIKGLHEVYKECPSQTFHIPS